MMKLQDCLAVFQNSIRRDAADGGGGGLERQNKNK